MDKLAQFSISGKGTLVGILTITLLNLLNLSTFVSFREYYAFIFLPGAVFIILLMYNYITYNISKQSVNGNTQQDILRNRDRSKRNCLRFARRVMAFGMAIVLWFFVAIFGYMLSNLPQF